MATNTTTTMANGGTPSTSTDDKPLGNKVTADDDGDADAETPSAPPQGQGDNPAHEQDKAFVTRLKDVLVKFAPLGVIAFGGPTAHIALLQDRFVTRLKWTDSETFMELFGLCQALPGPTSTQLVVALAAVHAGFVGGMLAFIMWSLPGLIIMTAAGVTSRLFFDTSGGTPDWMAGLGPAATAMVFVAAYQLSKSVVTSKVKILCATQACVVTLLVMGDSRVDPRLGSISFPLVLLLGGFITFVDSRRSPARLKEYYSPPPNEPDAKEAARKEHERMQKRINIPWFVGITVVVLWIAVIVVTVTLRSVGLITDPLGIVFESMFRIGSLIYGGGQVVLPMLLNENYCTRDQFFQGFALVQALPGPLFNFSAYLGGVYAGIPGAIVGYIALNGAGLLLIFGVLPFWARLRRNALFKVLITGIASAGLGLVYTACVQLWVSSVVNAAGAVVFVCSGVAVGFYNVPVPIGIIAGSLLGFIFTKTAIGVAQNPYCVAALNKPGFGSPNSTLAG